MLRIILFSDSENMLPQVPKNYSPNLASRKSYQLGKENEMKFVPFHLCHFPEKVEAHLTSSNPCVFFFFFLAAPG